MSITRLHQYSIELDNGTMETRWETPLTYGDKNADKIVATIMQGNEPATLTGVTAMLYGVRSVGTTAFKSGSISGSVVTIELDYPFYAISGKIELLLQLSEGAAVVCTPLRITAYVKDGQTEVLVSTGEQFSLAELEAIAAACQAATISATSATDLIRYAYIKWAAANPTSDGDMKNTPDAWIGVYVGTSQTAPTTYAAYQWYQYRGNDGTSAYVHVRWGTSATPETLLTVPAEYIGIASTSSATAPGTYSGYQWYLYKGDKGDAGVMTYSGTAITGTSATPTPYATGITLAHVGDRYYYNGTVDAHVGNVYRCTLGGDSTTALWVFDGNIRGIAGAGSVSTVDSLTPDINGNVLIDAVRFVAEINTSARRKVGAQNLFGTYGGSVVADPNAIDFSGFYTCYQNGASVTIEGVTSNTAHAPFTSESAFIIHVNSNVGVASAFQIAIGYTTGTVRFNAKRAGSWVGWGSSLFAQVETTATLASASWTGSAAPYTQTASISGILATSTGVEAGLSSAATQTQREAARAAILTATEYSNGSITIVADGDKPTIDLPFVVWRDA